MSEQQVNNVLGTAIDKIRDMVDVNTVIGEPIQTADGATIIPISKVTYGFASGGSDFGTKRTESGSKMGFMGGAGAGVSIHPVAFLSVYNGEVKVLQIEPYTSSVDRAIERVPDIVDKFSFLLSKENKDKKKENDGASEESPDTQEED